MSNLIAEFKKNKLANLKNSFNKTMFILNNNYNVEIRNVNIMRIHITLKKMPLIILIKSTQLVSQRSTFD